MTIFSAARDGEAQPTDRRMALAREWDQLVEQVRRIEGFENFLRPPPLATLLKAAAQGPVIIVNVSHWRCDALIVTADGVRPVELPGLTAAEVHERTAVYLDTLAGDKKASGLSFAQQIEARAASRARRESTLRDTMEWLWDAVAHPVLGAIGIDAPPPSGRQPPRVWWCPTGLLTMLPLHGAGYHAAGDGRTVLDRVISSYTPTLRALGEAVKPLDDDKAGEARLLFVGVPDAMDQVQLHVDVARERAVLAKTFPGGFSVVDGSDATMDKVSLEMARHRWIHISCHGYQNIYDPSRAGLILTDGILTIRRISASGHPGEFAFLSACMTATGGVTMPDEAITLAAALSYSGYRHVIATLWKVNSSAAADATEAVYPQMLVDGAFEADRAAIALHNAIHELRARGYRMSDWLPFTHSGP